MPLQNLIIDSSFESNLPLTFTSDTCYISKLEINDAFHGNKVMIVSGWLKNSGSTIKSRLIHLNDTEFCASIQIRRYGQKGKPTKISIFLIDSSNNKHTFNTKFFINNGGWEELSGTLVLPNMIQEGYFCIKIQGEHRGVQLQFDNFLLGRGNNLDGVSANTPFSCFIEAEDFADDVAWKTSLRNQEYMRYQKPSNGWLLNGSHKLTTNASSSKKVTVNRAGRYRLWLRFFVIHNAIYSARFSIALHQMGNVISSKDISDGDLQYKPSSFHWESIEGNLNAGEVTIVISRPAKAAYLNSGRRLDCLLLTDDIGFDIKNKYNVEEGRSLIINDLLPKSYFRFVITSPINEEFCISVYIYRFSKRPHYNGVLSHRGLIDSIYPPGVGNPSKEEKNQWLKTGDYSPWVEISRKLLIGHEQHILKLTATHFIYNSSLIKGNISGEVQFAVGNRRRIVKRVKFNQDAPILPFNIPFDFSKEPSKILFGRDIAEAKLMQCNKLGLVEHRRAKHIDLSTIINLVKGKHDIELIKIELEILRRLGLNNTYLSAANASEAIEFHAIHGLAQRFSYGIRDAYVLGIYSHLNNDMYHPNSNTIDEILERYYANFKPVLENLLRLDVMDEPQGIKYDDIIKSERLKEKFKNDLRDNGYTLNDLGVASWDDVVPVEPLDKDRHPHLFYHTAIFRLNALVHFLKTITLSKQKYFGVHGKTMVNYAPNHNGRTWIEQGVDPFFIQRSGALEMIGTEDWLDWGAGTQHMSYQYALLRAAGNNMQSLFTHIIVSNSKSNAILRLRIYSALAGGVRQLNYYLYGPSYLRLDTAFDNKFDLYPELYALNNEIARIDHDLNCTNRRKTDIALLYNRTAAIWEDKFSETSDLNTNLIHWALAHAGYDADFLSEEDIENGRLTAYKVLYISGPQIKQATTEAIKIWVNKGGYLFGSAGAGSRNEFNNNVTILSDVFGGESRELKLVEEAGRPFYEVRTLKNLGNLTVISPIPEVPTFKGFDQLCYSEYLEVLGDGKIFLMKNNDPAGIINEFGNGLAIRVVGLPGLSYLNESIRGENYKPNSYLPKNFSQSLRDFIVWPAKLANAKIVAETSESITEIVRYNGNDRAVIFIMDRSIKKHDSFLLKIPDALQYKTAYSATGNPVELGIEGNLRTIVLPLYIADAVVLKI